MFRTIAAVAVGFALLTVNDAGRFHNRLRRVCG